MGFGSQKMGGFNKLTRAYKNDPSIENYVKLRRGYPKAEIEIAILGGIEPLLYMEPELRRYGIDPNLVAGTMDADPGAIGEISLLLMEKIIEARKLTLAGKSHLSRRGLGPVVI
jgi:hypothetical protein